MTPQILTVVASTSGVIGFLSLLAYLYFNLQIRQISRAERSIRDIVEGDGLFNADQVLEILREFKDEANRLKALDALTDHSYQSVQRVYDKIKGRIDISQIASKPNRATESVSLTAAVLFFSLAVLALLYSIFGSGDGPGQHQSRVPPVKQGVDLQDEKKAVLAGKKQATPVEYLAVTWQPSVVTERNLSYNALTFRVTNNFDSNIRDVEIAIYPVYPYPRLDMRSFFANTAKCSPISGDPSAWKTQCDYIGVGGTIGLSLSTDLNQKLPSGEIVISNPDGTKRTKFSE